MKIVYVGGQGGGLDIPSLDIVGWMPGEAKDVPDDVAEELLARADFVSHGPVAPG